MRRFSLVPVVPLLVLLLGCKSETTAPPPAPGIGSPSPSASSPVTAGGAPQDALARMDTRKDVPLLPMMANHQKQNMRDHLVAVQEIVAAVAVADFAAVEKAAGRIGFSEQMGAMCTHMGSGAPGFTEQAIGFHKTADGIVAAAKKKDRDGVLSALGATLTTCTSCHATWKQKVVDEATFSSVSKQPAPMGSMHGMHGGPMHGP